jgi:hypothetical protein
MIVEFEPIDEELLRIITQEMSETLTMGKTNIFLLEQNEYKHAQII